MSATVQHLAELDELTLGRRAADALASELDLDPDLNDDTAMRFLLDARASGKEQHEPRLACPSCRTASLATLEAISGAAHADFRLAGGDVEVEHQGETDIDWDSSTTEGLCCGWCGWLHQGTDWWELVLVQVPVQLDWSV